MESPNAFPLGLTIVLLRCMPSLRLPKPWREKVEATRRRTVITTPEHVPVNVLMLLPSLSVCPPAWMLLCRAAAAGGRWQGRQRGRSGAENNLRKWEVRHVVIHWMRETAICTSLVAVALGLWWDRGWWNLMKSWVWTGHDRTGRERYQNWTLCQRNEDV